MVRRPARNPAARYFTKWSYFETRQRGPPMILPYSGEKTLVIGADHGHTGPSAEVDADPPVPRAARRARPRQGAHLAPQPQSAVWVIRGLSAELGFFLVRRSFTLW